MYTRCHTQPACLHSSIFHFALQYEPIEDCYRARKKGCQSGSPRNPSAIGPRLFRSLLARRVERAGIMDLRDLMIAEAEHFAQDLVGMFAEQR